MRIPLYLFAVVVPAGSRTKEANAVDGLHRHDEYSQDVGYTPDTSDSIAFW